MRSLVHFSLTSVGVFALLVLTVVYRPGLEQRAHARNAASTQAVPVRVPTVSPNSVKVNSQGATSVLLTYSGVVNLQPVEATFCNELVPVFSGSDPVSANFGFKCKPGTSFGRVPQRYNRSTLSANNTFTDIVSVTPQIARRAYLEAVRGSATFFYVRRFVNTATGREVGVPLTIRLSSNGAGLPFSITEVKLKWGDSAKPIVFVKTGEELPRVQASITYTGTGRLKGRWELVRPGDIQPESRDLLTEATLPFEQRTTQKRYMEISRFNLYLPPRGKILLQGPEGWRVDKSLTGLYRILLRIEATSDTQGVVPAPALPGESALDAAQKKVPGGGVAGFPLPSLKYYVADGSATPPATITRTDPFEFSPEDQARLDTDQPVDFTWPLDNAAKYRFEVEDLQGAPIISAILPGGVSSYRAPSWFKEKVGKSVVRWRVVSYDQQGNEIEKSEWRSLRFVTGTDRKQP